MSRPQTRTHIREREAAARLHWNKPSCRTQMSSDEASKPDSAGAHSAHSQLIVVSPRPDPEEAHGETNHFVVSNPRVDYEGWCARWLDRKNKIILIVDFATCRCGHIVVHINYPYKPVVTYTYTGCAVPFSSGQVTLTFEMTDLEQHPTSTRNGHPPPPPPPSTLQLEPSNSGSGGYQPLAKDEDHPMSPIDEQVLEEVLYNRPTLRLGRELSMRFRAQTAIPSRRRKTYQSLPHSAKRPKTTGALSIGVCVCVCVWERERERED